MHLAGHALKTDRAGRPLAIDTHDGPVQDSTWHLFRIALQTTGRVPVLIEWDSQLPEWPALMEQARMAEQAMNDGARETHHAHGSMPERFARALCDADAPLPDGLCAPGHATLADRFAVYRNNVHVSLVELGRGLSVCARR